MGCLARIFFRGFTWSFTRKLHMMNHASPQSRKIGPVSGRIPVSTGPRLIHTEVFRDRLVLVAPLILQTSRREPVHVDHDHIFLFFLNDIICFKNLRWLEQRVSSSRIKRFMFFGRVYWLNCYPANYLYVVIWIYYIIPTTPGRTLCSCSKNYKMQTTSTQTLCWQQLALLRRKMMEIVALICRKGVFIFR